MEADIDDFLLFLCHLYFAHQHCCMPFTVSRRVDLHAQPPPDVTLDCSACEDWNELREATDSVLDELKLNNEPLAVYWSVMSLCHHFRCAKPLSRAEHNLLVPVQSTDDLIDYDASWMWNQLWLCFLLALKFDLKQVRRQCLPRLVQHCSMHGSRRAEWETARAQLSEEEWDSVRPQLSAGSRNSSRARNKL